MFEFYVPPTSKVIQRRDLCLKTHPKVWRSPGSNSRSLVYEASSLTTKPRRLQRIRLCFPCKSYMYIIFLVPEIRKKNFFLLGVGRGVGGRVGGGEGVGGRVGGWVGGGAHVQHQLQRCANYWYSIVWDVLTQSIYKG